MTVAGTVFDTIVDNWGNGGYAGDLPSIDTTETQTSSDVGSDDVIEVRHHTQRETPDQFNDSFTDRFHFIDVYVSSKTSAAQLKLLFDEVEYLLRNTTMTDLKFVNVVKDYTVMMWEQGRHSVVLKFELVTQMSDGAISPAAGAAATILTPHFMQFNVINGASYSITNGLWSIKLPAADNNASIYTGFKIPSTWASAIDATLNVWFWRDADAAYAGKWYISAHGVGDTVSLGNILNASGAHDFPAGTATKITLLQITGLSGIAADDMVGVFFASDELNTPNLYIQDMWWSQ